MTSISKDQRENPSITVQSVCTADICHSIQLLEGRVRALDLDDTFSSLLTSESKTPGAFVANEGRTIWSLVPSFPSTPDIHTSRATDDPTTKSSDGAPVVTESTISREEAATDVQKTIPQSTQSPSWMESVPVEVWGQVFSLCLPDDQFVIPDGRQAPLLLCQICQTWRNIAFSTPSLWSSLSIRIACRRPAWRQFLQSWLTRAGNTLLDLEVSVPVFLEMPIFVEPRSDHIFQMITLLAPRWRRLRLNVAEHVLSSMLDTPMPELQILELNSTRSITSLTIPRSQAPRLRTVSLLTNALYPQLLCLPWDQLTSLSSQCWLNIKQHIDILRRCPKVENYQMVLLHVADLPCNSPPLKMEHLRSLQIVAFIGATMGPVLNRLQLPVLEELSFIVPVESPACGIAKWPRTHLVSLIERSNCLLKTLSFHGMNTRPEDSDVLKGLIPSLETIEF